MTKTLTHRILAFIIDYGIIAAYATLLFLVANLFFFIFDWRPGNNPIIGQLYSKVVSNRSYKEVEN